MDDSDSCGSIDNNNGLLSLRIAAVFIILVTSTSAATFPILAKRSKLIQIPELAYE